MQPDPDEVYLLDILKSAKWALSHLEGITLEQFLKDVKTQDSVIRRLVMIGEAARRISEHTRKRLNEVPWKTMIGMRNFLIHEYDDIDLTIVWDTVKNDIPSVIETIQPHVPPDSE